MGITTGNRIRFRGQGAEDFRSSLSAALLPGTLAAGTTFLFGILAAVMLIQAALTSAMNPLEPVSVFSVMGVSGEVWGLTFGGPGMAIFPTDTLLAGTEGALLATAFAGLTIVCTLFGLVPIQGIRIAGAFYLLSFSLLWVTNAARLATLERDGPLVLAAIGLLIASLGCIKRLDTVLREL
ncbi:MAG: hypothetical protein AAGB51_02525 [Planctomycetota bacterium]